MKNQKSLYTLITFLLCISSFQASGQDLNLFNDINLDSTLIKEFGIKSLIVYSDYAEDGLEESSFSITSKWKEISFNEEGQPTYIRTVPLFGEYAYLGVANPTWHFFEYDSRHRTSYIRVKSEHSDNEEFYTFNDENRKTKIVSLNKGEPYSTTTFKWQGDILIDYTSTMADSAFNFVKNTYGSDGNLNSIEYSSVRIDIETKTLGEITEQSMKSYRDEKLTSQQTMRTNSPRKRMEYFISLDEKKDTLKEIIAKFDQHHNIIYFHSKDFSNRRNYQEFSPPPMGKPSGQSQNAKEYSKTKNPIPPPFESIYEIENIYDYRGLLIKQKYVEIDAQNPRKKKLISVQRFVYETDDLLIQPLPVDEE